MFKEWIEGVSTFVSLAAKYGMHETTVRAIARRNNWQDLKKKFRDRLYLDTLDAMKDRIVGLIGVLDADVTRLKRSVNARKKEQQLSKDERSYVLKYLEVLLHESKLHDGKPTTINSGEVVTRIVLPEGVEDAWIIPPDPSVKIEREKKEDAPGIDDAQFEQLLDDHREKKS